MLRVFTDEQRRRERRWCEMRKGVSDLWRNFEVGIGSNHRYLDALAAAPLKGEGVAALDALCRPRTNRGPSVARFSPLSTSDLALFRAALAFEHACDNQIVVVASCRRANPILPPPLSPVCVAGPRCPRTSIERPLEANPYRCGSWPRARVTYLGRDADSCIERRIGNIRCPWGNSKHAKAFGRGTSHRRFDVRIG